MGPTRKRCLRVTTYLLGFVGAMGAAGWSWAGPTSGNMPWSGPLETLRENLTGPTLTAVVLIGIALGLAAWALGDSNRGLLRAGKALIALAVGAGGVLLITALGITASVV